MTPQEEFLQITAEEQMERKRIQLESFLNTYYKKPYVLECRVKSIEKLRMKQELLSKKRGYQVDLAKLPDIIGFRISVDEESDVEELSALVQDILNPSRLIDYFNTPRTTGFKAYLYYFEDIGINTEIQIMTIKMKDWTNITHDEHNMRKYGQK